MNKYVLDRSIDWICTHMLETFIHWLHCKCMIHTVTAFNHYLAVEQGIDGHLLYCFILIKFFIKQLFFKLNFMCCCLEFSDMVQIRVVAKAFKHWLCPNSYNNFSVYFSDLSNLKSVTESFFSRKITLIYTMYAPCIDQWCFTF